MMKKGWACVAPGTGEKFRLFPHLVLERMSPFGVNLWALLNAPSSPHRLSSLSRPLWFVILFNFLRISLFLNRLTTFKHIKCYFFIDSIMRCMCLLRWGGTPVHVMLRASRDYKMVLWIYSCPVPSLVLQVRNSRRIINRECSWRFPRWASHFQVAFARRSDLPFPPICQEGAFSRVRRAYFIHRSTPSPQPSPIPGSRFRNESPCWLLAIFLCLYWGSAHWFQEKVLPMPIVAPCNISLFCLARFENYQHRMDSNDSQ